ncbi:helix-turn-helix domain-containing protein [Nocardia sp. NBC_01503]|uniref:helix-turn-helix domain-containing protein n=1 Tax=Nocardia sp. NBC_01503 TaxID=2975997 RepID=UPI002E7AC99E|nr:helix-turn-helix domain-containing protein [Nocardia sp. NBC_01503]
MSASSYLTRAEAAERLRHSVQTLANWASRGTGPRFVRFGNGRCLYPLDELIGWEQSNLK